VARQGVARQDVQSTTWGAGRTEGSGLRLPAGRGAGLGARGAGGGGGGARRGGQRAHLQVAQGEQAKVNLNGLGGRFHPTGFIERRRRAVERAVGLRCAARGGRASVCVESCCGRRVLGCRGRVKPARNPAGQRAVTRRGRGPRRRIKFVQNAAAITRATGRGGGGASRKPSISLCPGASWRRRRRHRLRRRHRAAPAPHMTAHPTPRSPAAAPWCTTFQAPC
jgi:hypothetical protein